ncbi:MAG: mannose-1-phosphate guanylyltransferase/mannose-6-phosphate isomerase, partial [Alphaproteobacteria bacterium]
MATIHPVILCGGSGTRLWPLSRKSYPKQFSALLDDRSLFQAAALRLQGQAFAAPIIVTADAFRFIVTEQLAEIGIEPAAILIEPEGRNTAPAVLAAAEWLRAAGRGGQMLVAPSDHLIPDEAAFRDAVAGAVPAASAGKLVTFGIRPTRPETGYGWLELSSPEDAGASRPVPLRRFVEKPPPDRAAEMLAGGRHLWNAGIFLFSVDAIHDAFTRHAPDMVPPVGRAVERARADLAFTRLDAEAWAAARAESIDYAVMEKAGNLAVMPFPGAWSDLGDWEAIRRVTADDDAAGNATHGPVLALDCENTLLRAESEGQQLVAIGLSDVVAVAMPDAVLVAHASRAQEVKDAVDRMRRDGTRQADSFPRDHRPWGW